MSALPYFYFMKKESYSMFAAIHVAAERLRMESERLSKLARISRTITCGELQKVLDDTRVAVRELKRIH